MTREETVKNLLTELIDMIDNGSQRDLDRADEIGTSIIKLFKQEPILDKIRAEIEKPLRDERCFDTADAKAQYIALNWCIEIIDKYKAKIESQETETWNGYHGQITAPKGTFERIFNDVDDEDDI